LGMQTQPNARPTAKQPPLTLSVMDAADRLGVRRQAMYRLVNENRVPVIRLSPHRMRVAVADLDRLFGTAA
jgi:excisionase family DNA binding protein